MKPILIILGGFGLTVGTFAAGAVAATALLAADPVETRVLSSDTTSLWTTEPVRVDREASDLQRVAPVQAAVAKADTQLPTPPVSAQEPVDEMMTAALPEPEQPTQMDAEVIAAHVDWCSRRYRSFNLADNSYRAFSGERRECVSPHLAEAAAALDAINEAPVQAEEAAYEEAAYNDDGSLTSGLSAAHIQNCYDRYRSYRPEDNTYQPYGGGARRQCE